MEKSRKNKPVKQHYVTKGYIEGFTENKKCAVKDLITKQIRENESPNNICKTSNYITLDIPEDPYGLEKDKGRCLSCHLKWFYVFLCWRASHKS